MTTVPEICSRKSLPKDLYVFLKKIWLRLLAWSCSLYHPEHLIFCGKKKLRWSSQLGPVCYTSHKGLIYQTLSINMSNFDLLYLLALKHVITFLVRPRYPNFSSGSFHKSSLGSTKTSDVFKKLNYKLILPLYLLETGWYRVLYKYEFLKILLLNKYIKMAIPIFSYLWWDFPLKLLF